MNDGGYGKDGRNFGSSISSHLNGSAADAMATMVSTDTSADQGIEPGEERNKVEMVANRPTPDSAKRSEAASSQMFHDGRQSHRPRQRADRRDHELHEHEQSERDARRRFAREESGRARPARRSAVKTSLAPGSRVVTDYLQKTGLQTYLDQLGFNIVGYGCTTCIGNSGPLASEDREDDQRNTIWWPLPSFPAIAISKRACIKTSRRTS